MFQKTELERLRLHKEQLVAQSEANRVALLADWQRLQSSGNWLNNASGFLRRPIWSTATAVAAGILAMKTFRKSGSIFGTIGRLGQYGSTALAIWKLFSEKIQK
ncbi:MAG TPA: hypothetical protein VHG71_01450 [Verrucomicrobiae bacterium]|nr:hypothetical protein [Verrucomicrobiae bacterium]